MANKTLVLTLILLAIPLSGVGIDIYSPSLPAIAQGFKVHHSLAKISIAIYLLGFSVGQLFTGPFSDSYGRKNVLLTGLVSFVAFSVLAALSKNIQFFLIMRLLQGLAVTAPVVVAKSIATDCFKGDELRKVSTYLVIAWSVGPIVAPVIGAHLQTFIGWQANFYFLALYGLLIFILALVFLPETNRNLIRLSLKKVKNNYTEILANKKFVGCIICLAIGYSQIAIFNVIGPFVIQEGLKYSALVYGHIALLIGFACFSGSILNRFLIKNISQYKIITYAILVMLMASTLLLILTLFYSLSLIKLVLPIFIILFCVGIIYPNCSAICLSMFPKIAGSASAMMGVITILGTVAMTSIASILESSTVVPLALLYLFLTLLILVIFKSLVNQKPVIREAITHKIS